MSLDRTLSCMLAWARLASHHSHDHHFVKLQQCLFRNMNLVVADWPFGQCEEQQDQRVPRSQRVRNFISMSQITWSLITSNLIHHERHSYFSMSRFDVLEKCLDVLHRHLDRTNCDAWLELLTAADECCSGWKCKRRFLKDIQCCTTTQFVNRNGQIKLEVTKDLRAIFGLTCHIQQLFHTPTPTFWVLEDTVKPRNIVGTHQIRKYLVGLLVDTESTKCFTGVEMLRRYNQRKIWESQIK